MEALAIDPIIKLTKDLKKSSVILTASEARYLVDLYYHIQDYRIQAANQERSEKEEPHELVHWIFTNMRLLEGNVKRAFGAYTDASIVGVWAKSIHGISDVISAGLLAHIDMKKATYPTKVMRFAGLDPTIKWGKGQKRPYNAKLKTLCWKIGESFVKVSNSEKDFYGKFWREKKDTEIITNENGGFLEQCKLKMENNKIRSDKVAYYYYTGVLTLEGAHELQAMIVPTVKRAKELSSKDGFPMLPPGHVHSRAKRYAVKMFISHWHTVAFEDYYKRKAPLPWIIQHGGHEDIIPPPNFRSKYSD